MMHCLCCFVLCSLLLLRLFSIKVCDDIMGKHGPLLLLIFQKWQLITSFFPFFWSNFFFFFSLKKQWSSHLAANRAHLLVNRCAYLNLKRGRKRKKEGKKRTTCKNEPKNEKLIRILFKMNEKWCWQWY